ncbi:uncharacterized protein PRCAT00000763001 [Priceomyces carsonii]|uniref:uncharacterized protein n=1 Tax=Priceomyces carsonii TaxID=28549 RepID=UPI002EDB3326|nr:unnamed protein product [Priceomyces carsonii]
MNKGLRIFTLGAGAMGSLVTHEISNSFASTQLVLLLRNQRRVEQFLKDGSEITIVRSQDGNILKSTTKHDVILRPPRNRDDEPEIIENLILATKTYQTENALEKYVSNLDKTSNILIVQNGMGMSESLIERFWPTKANRPNFYQAVSTHGAYKTSLNTINHVGLGKLKISAFPGNNDESLLSEYKDDNSEKFKFPLLIRDILDIDVLNVEFLPYETFLLHQMEKLVANACINPLTALLDCLNGDLLSGSKVISIMKRVIIEATDVFKAEFKILETIPISNVFLNRERLLNSVFEVCKLTSQNSSSMREDIKHLNQTEIDWINGYIVALGNKHHIPTPTNKFITSMIKNKLSIDREIDKTSADVYVK